MKRRVSPVRVTPGCNVPAAQLARSVNLVYRGQVDFDAYARTAVEIVNKPFTSPDDLVFPPVAGAWSTPQPTERDLAVIRRTRQRLREIFDLGSHGQTSAAVAELNALLAAFPVRPRITGHHGEPWHMHVTGRGSSTSSEYLATAIWGLAVWVCEHGTSRFGVCADERCRNVYLDTSSNCCRRFCSERCATRSHVAAHRARKRANELVPVP